MKEDLYIRLGERLNQNEVKMPLIDAVLEFLRDVFTEEQAGLGAEFPLGAHTLKALATQLSRDEKELERLLESMADEGLIFIAATDKGAKEYSLSPYVPGILEFQYIRGEDTAKVRRRTALITQIWATIEAGLGQLYKNADPALLAAQVPTMRTVAIEERLPDNAGIATWEQMSAILNREESFAAGYCYCREKTRLSGHPCHLTNLPPEACIYFGKAADFMVERKFAKRFSREGILQLLKDCEKAGLVHTLNNFIGENTVLCNCCGCCCGIITMMKKIKGYIALTGSNFVAGVDEKICNGCGQCIDHCQVNALEINDDQAVVNRDKCLGCGNCVDKCPVEAISLRRCAEKKPPQKNPKIVGLGY